MKNTFRTLTESKQWLINTAHTVARKNYPLPSFMHIKTKKTKHHS